MLERVVSGGQTGVDRAALDAAMAAGLAVGGWCPAGRRAEDGPIPARYPLRETEAEAYHVRTRRNVRDSDATLLLAPAPLVGGTALTEACAVELGRPCLHVERLHVEQGPAVSGVSEGVAAVRAWLRRHEVRVLNVAGPRESTVPGIYAAAAVFLTRLFEAPSAEAPSVEAPG